MSRSSELRALAEKATDLQTITAALQAIDPEVRTNIRFTFKADGPGAEYLIACSPERVLSLLSAVATLRGEVRNTLYALAEVVDPRFAVEHERLRAVMAATEEWDDGTV